MKQKKTRLRNIPKSVLETVHSPEDFTQINPFVDIWTIHERIRLRKEQKKGKNKILPLYTYYLIISGKRSSSSSIAGI